MAPSRLKKRERKRDHNYWNSGEEGLENQLNGKKKKKTDYRSLLKTVYIKHLTPGWFYPDYYS